MVPPLCLGDQGRVRLCVLCVDPVEGVVIPSRTLMHSTVSARSTTETR